MYPLALSNISAYVNVKTNSHEGVLDVSKQFVIVIRLAERRISVSFNPTWLQSLMSLLAFQNAHK